MVPFDVGGHSFKITLSCSFVKYRPLHTSSIVFLIANDFIWCYLVVPLTGNTTVTHLCANITYTTCFAFLSVTSYHLSMCGSCSSINVEIFGNRLDTFWYFLPVGVKSLLSSILDLGTMCRRTILDTHPSYTYEIFINENFCRSMAGCRLMVGYID